MRARIQYRLEPDEFKINTKNNQTVPTGERKSESLRTLYARYILATDLKNQPTTRYQIASR